MVAASSPTVRVMRRLAQKQEHARRLLERTAVASVLTFPPSRRGGLTSVVWMLVAPRTHGVLQAAKALSRSAPFSARPHRRPEHSRGLRQTRVAVRKRAAQTCEGLPSVE